MTGGFVVQTDKASWIKHIHNEIKRGRHFVCAIVGAPGTGKSMSSLSIAEQSDQTFNIERCIFRPRDLLRMATENLPPGSAIVVEEVGVTMNAQNWMDKVNKAMGMFFQTCRHRHWIIILNLPNITFLNRTNRLLLDAIFETVRIDVERQVCVLKPKLVQMNALKSETYEKYLRVITPKGRRRLTKWAVPRPSKEHEAQYEKKKSDYTKKLYARLDKELSGIDPDEGEQAKLDGGWHQMKCLECGRVFRSKSDIPSKCQCGTHHTQNLATEQLNPRWVRLMAKSTGKEAPVGVNALLEGEKELVTPVNSS